MKCPRNYRHENLKF